MGTLAFAYFESYVNLSLQGSYEPDVTGVNGVKIYSWAPKGFAHQFDWKVSRIFFYCGLWTFDNWNWHRSGPWYDLSRKYSVDIISKSDFDKYLAKLSEKKP